MVKSREKALLLVRELRDHLAAIYGDRLKGVYLFGSYARGEAGDDSDIDVAIVLGGVFNARQETHRIIPLVSDLCLREDCLIVPFLLSEEERRTTPYAVHRAILLEGIPA